MQWSKFVLPKDVAAIKVLDYKPTQFNLGTPNQALDYLKEKSRGSDFRMNDTIRVQTGIDQLEKESEAERVEKATLEKLKEVQEDAYQQAYELGREEGHKDAFDKMSSDINRRLQDLDQLLSTVGHLKTEMVAFNESHILRSILQMASKLARKEVETSPETLLSVLKESVALSQDEENVTILIAQEQLEFIEGLQNQSGREFEFLKKIKIQASPDVTIGGCIVQTNYGEVDARLEQRIDTLWQAVSENLPKVKDKIAG